MLPNANFLFEIGTEEIPAGYCPPAIEMLRRLVTEQLEDKRIGFGAIDVKATPRRFAVTVADMAQRQYDHVVELKGPSVKAGFDDTGKPTRALEGFLAGNNLTLDDIEKRETPKGAYVFAEKTETSRNTELLLSEICKVVVEKLAFPKKMTWADRKISFPRPIRYFLLLFNDKPVSFEIEGIGSGNVTRGHYVQHNEYVEIPSISDYEKILESKWVILDHEKRKDEIRKSLHDAARKAGGVLLDDEDLVETVAYLVEKPHVATCRFKESFLSIPHLVLIAEMKEHQKYFAVVDDRGKLTNTFLVISNNPVTKNVVAGNERVISARFSDAEFFYTEDRKAPLASRVESLKNVLFHKELGSVYDKMTRMESIARYIADTMSLDDEEITKIERAVFLSKSDLDTALVYEFPSLQGKIGHIYALEDGEDTAVAAAIEDHYRPRSQDDIVPESNVSLVVSMAEKIDNIFGSYSVGNIPKGSQDPYALRRQAGALVDMLVSRKINMPLEDILHSSSQMYKDGPALVPQILDFFKARVKTLFAEAGFSHDEIDACLAVASTDFFELYRRAQSVHEFRQNENFSAMLLGFKRMNNILAAFRNDNPDYSLSVDSKLFEHDAEKELFSFFDERKNIMFEMIQSSMYIKLFTVMTEGRKVIDDFFDTVMVMDERTAVRDNRLALLESILHIFSKLIDFSRISDK